MSYFTQTSVVTLHENNAFCYVCVICVQMVTRAWSSAKKIMMPRHACNAKTDSSAYVMILSLDGIRYMYLVEGGLSRTVEINSKETHYS